MRSGDRTRINVLRLCSVFEPGDPEALARAIDRLLAEPDLARRLGEAARKRARDYDWGVLAERVLTVYRSLIAGSS